MVSGKRGGDALTRAAAALLAVACVVLVAAAAGAQPARVITSIFDPVSPPSEEIFTLSVLVLGICAAIFVVVAGLTTYAIVAFRRRADDDGIEPPQVYGSNPIELAWTVVPLLIVFVLFLVTTRTILAVQKPPPFPPSTVNVTVIGHQWWWEFRYPDLGVVTANELHVPVSAPNDPRPTALRLESVDVVHSFWVPQLNGKTDVIPNRVNTTWIEPMQTGVFLGQCAEYCGTQHAHMLLRVVVHSPSEFEEWVAEQRASVTGPATTPGRDAFQSAACINCHRVGGTVADGVFGPDLTHLMSRATIGAGVAPNTAENLRAWVTDPDQLKPGVLMPAMKLDEQTVAQIVDYLTTLK